MTKEWTENGRTLEIAHLEEAQAVSQTGSFTWDAETGEVLVSAQARRIMALPMDLVVTLPDILSRVHPDDLVGFEEVVVKGARERQGFDHEHRLLLPDQTVKYVHTRARPFGESMTRFVGAVIDITTRKKIELQLSESEYNYRNLFQAIAAAFWVVDFRGVGDMLRKLRKSGVSDLPRYFALNPDFVRAMMEASLILDVNDQTLNVFGEGRKTHLPESIAPFWPPESNEIYAESVVAAITGKPRYSAETVLCDINGRKFEALFTTCFPPGSVAQGKILVGVIDISDRVRAQKQLQALQAEFAHADRVSTLGELTASIAHEVNQPLAAIATNAAASQRWLNRVNPDIEEVRVLTGRIIEDAQRAASIISRVRSMASRRASEMAEIDLADAIGDAMLFLRHEMISQKVVLRLDAPADLPKVMADRTQVQQVLVNLTINAIQAMRVMNETQRSLTVRARADGGHVVISVADTGPGIPEDHMPKLFESFFSTKENGMGIGLAICRSIVEAHGGTLSARNGESGGAVFEFRLPVMAAADHTDV